MFPRRSRPISVKQFTGWLRRNWGVISLLAIVTILAVQCERAINDVKGRTRVASGLSQASSATTAVNNYFERTKALPADLSSFITQPHYVWQPNLKDPRRIAFVLKADEQRLRIVFDE